MWPIVKRFAYDLIYSPERARLWFRGVATWVATSAGLVVAYPPEVITAWRLRDWALRFLIAGVSGLAVMAKAGDRNPTSTPNPEPKP